MKKLLASAVLAALLLGQVTASEAITFAQYKDGATGFKLTNAAGGPFGTIATLAAPVSSTYAIKFSYENGVGLLPSGTDIDAFLTFTSTGTNPALISGPAALQAFGTTSFSIVANGAQLIGSTLVANGDNLLTGTSSLTLDTDILSGNVGGFSASFSGSDLPFLNTVTYTSDYIPAFTDPCTIVENKAFAFSYTLNNRLTASGFPFTFIDPFTAASTATFNADFTPGDCVPEPGTVAMLIGMGVSGGLLAIRRRRK